MQAAKKCRARVRVEASMKCILNFKWDTSQKVLLDGA